MSITESLNIEVPIENTGLTGTLTISNIKDGNLVLEAINKLDGLMSSTPNPGLLFPIIKETFRSRGMEVSLTATGNWRKYKLMFSIWYLDFMYKKFGAERYKQIFKLEVPND